MPTLKDGSDFEFVCNQADYFSPPKTIPAPHLDRSPPSEVNIITCASPQNTMTKGDSASERMQEDQQLMQKLGIYPVYQDEAFPVHLSHTFEQVKEFRRFGYLTYTTDASWESPHHLVWRKETKSRAKRIADTAAKLKEEGVNEMEWRLRIEELVLFRFRVEIEW